MSRFGERDDDDDDFRLRKAELQLHVLTIRKLLQLKSEMTHGERGLLADLDFRACVMGEALSEFHVRGLKDLAWKYRRRLAAGTAPKVPPRDPIVREMEKRR